MTEVRLWDVASGALVVGMPESFVHCHQALFSPDSTALVTVEPVGRNPDSPVRSWRLSADRKRISLGESLRGDQFKARLSGGHPRADSAQGPFQLSDVLNVTPQDGSNLAVWLDGGGIDIRDTHSAFCKAICRVVGPEVVFIPRTNQTVPYTQGQVDEIGRIVRH